MAKKTEAKTEKLEPKDKVKKDLTAKPDIKKGETQMRYRVQFDVGYRRSPGKTFDQENNTIPDMNLTVRQLMENHTRGIDNEIHAKQPLYFEHTLPRIEDLTDVEKYKEYLMEQKKMVDEFIQKDLYEAEEKRRTANEHSTEKEPSNTNANTDD